jgi:hypothetical protein
MNVNVPRGNLNIPRYLMPQIHQKDHQDFIDFLRSKSIPVKRINIRVNDLKATQKEINLDRVAEKMSSLDKIDKPILVSNDAYVLDGHHLWLAKYNLDPMSYVDCYLIGQKIRDLLNTTRTFPKVFYKTINEVTMIDDMPASLVEKVRKILDESEENKEDDTKKIEGKKREKITVNPEIGPDSIREPIKDQTTQSQF